MALDVKHYYNLELKYLFELGAQFKAKYPGVAERLELGEHDSPDPHVERLLQGFAFLAARIHLKMEDEFPEITDALLNIVYPHYLRPTPSATIAEFHLDPQQGKLTTGLPIPRGATLYTRAIDGIQYKFRTTSDINLWPFEVASAEWVTPDKVQPAVRGMGGAAVVRIVLQCAPEVRFSQLAINSLRFYLSGGSAFTAAMYELLVNSCAGIVVRDKLEPQKAVSLRPTDLVPSGFDANQSLLPSGGRSFDGYRLLQEYFVFPRKFHFLELKGLDAAVAAQIGSTVEILMFLRPFQREDRRQVLEQGTTPKAFRLGCVPAVNLFQQSGEPILLKHTQYEYPVTPDANRPSVQVFSIDEVVSATPGSSEIVRYNPYFSLRHSDDRARKTAFWYASYQEPYARGKADSGVWITLVDLGGKPVVPDVEALTVRLTCANGDLSRMPFDSEQGDFQLQGGGPIQQIRAIERPTPAVQPRTGRSAFWKLISHLSLNHLSLVNEGREALQEMLQLYNVDESPSIHAQIQAIRSVERAPHFARVNSEHGISFARGQKIMLDIDEEPFAGANLYLFGSVLERFFGMYTSLNSFTQLEIRTPQRKDAFGKWLPRSGRKHLM